ncbi:methyltransferase domain-containing protein [Actinoplanes sp. NPDC049548]|uniref:class I SAM-dependent methyltransferase n=1 Tax=Actinoplanes sp. NPDC049548 TaxID=3155152 RepID=UPI003427C4EC
MDSDLIRAFDEAAATYDAVGVDFFTPMGAELVRRAAIRPGEHVLDVGCGRGAVLVPAARAAGPQGRVTGIDLSPAMVGLTSRSTAGLPGVTVALGDAQDPSFPPASFDVVTAGLVLFFLPDPLAALSAYRRLLKPGGRLAFSSFAGYDPHYPRAMKALARYAAGPVESPPDPGIFKDEGTIGAALAESGYQPVSSGEHVVISHFRDVDHWMRWVGSHGGRRLVRRIPAESLADAAAAAAAELEPARTPDGRLQLTTTIRITVAR